MRLHRSRYALLKAIISVAVCFAANAQDQTPAGSIRGKVVDAETKMPLAGVNVVLLNTHRGSATDSSGNYSIGRIPVGSYSLRFSYISYDPLTETDVILRPDRITYCNAELKASAIETQEVVVTGGYFVTQAESPTSVISFSFEEIRRAPGSAGDVSRIVYGLPGVAKVDDSKNSLIVRGGASCENGFYVDNIEIPNINHYPEYGASGGPIGMLNVDFIQGVDFYTGAFSVMYGDRLSSIMDLSFREGNRDEYDAQLDLNLAGFGGSVEGPLSFGKGSWLISAKKSFLDLIVKAIGEDENSVPDYGDIQAKIVYDVSQQHQLSVLEVLGIDAISSDKGYAVEKGASTYGSFHIVQNTLGVNWRWLWGQNGYSNTSLSHTLVAGSYVSFDTRAYRDNLSEKKLFEFEPAEHDIKLRNVNYYIVNPSTKLRFGVELKHTLNYYDHYYGENTDALGNTIQTFRIDSRLSASKVAGFVGCEWRPGAGLTLGPGIRVSHFTYNKSTNVSPRLAVSYQLDELTTLNGSTGIYYQDLPLVFVTQNPVNKNLRTPRADHIVIGMSRLLSESTRLTVEAYAKEYRHLPVDPKLPTFCLMDQMAFGGLFYDPNRLADDGEAYARGIEIMLQKKLARDLYGMVSASYFRAKYRDYAGTWRNRMYDNRVTFNVEGGYKPDNKWEFSLRWIYAGGRPYTPVDVAASEAAIKGIYDAARTNAMRLPDYHSLSIRVDRRFMFSGSNLIFYFSVWNVYGRKNLSSYEWDTFENAPKEKKQWGLLPIFGLEFEF